MKIYIVFEGPWDERIGLITDNLEKAYNYSDNTKKITDIREYEIIKNQFTRPNRP